MELSYINNGNSNEINLCQQTIRLSDFVKPVFYLKSSP